MLSHQGRFRISVLRLTPVQLLSRSGFSWSSGAVRSWSFWSWRSFLSWCSFFGCWHFFSWSFFCLLTTASYETNCGKAKQHQFDRLHIPTPRYKNCGKNIVYTKLGEQRSVSNE